MLECIVKVLAVVDSRLPYIDVSGPKVRLAKKHNEFYSIE